MFLPIQAFQARLTSLASCPGCALLTPAPHSCALSLQQDREGDRGRDIVVAHRVSLWEEMPEHPNWSPACPVRLWEMPTQMGGQGELWAGGGISEMLLWSGI